MEYAERICAMGDSITCGIGLPEGAPDWFAQLALRFPKARFLNLSHGGESSRAALDKLDMLRDSKPDIVTAQYGMNDHYLLEDGANNVPLDEFERNMRAIVSAVPRAKVILITNHAILEGDDQSYYYHRHPRALYAITANQWIERYNAATRRVAREMGCRLVDMWAVSSEYPPIDFLRTSKNTDGPEGDDGVHPHVLGHAAYARAVGAALEEMLMKG